MIRKTPIAVPRHRDPAIDEDLAGILTAISVVSRRLARRLALEQRQTHEGGRVDAQSPHAGQG